MKQEVTLEYPKKIKLSTQKAKKKPKKKAKAANNYVEEDYFDDLDGFLGFIEDCELFN